MRKLLSAGIIAALCFTSAATAFADTAGSQPEMKDVATETPKAAQQAQLLSTKLPDLKQAATGKAVSGEIKVVHIKSSANEFKESDATVVQYNQDEVLGDYDSSYYRVGYSQKVTFSAKGTLLMAVKNNPASGKDVTFGLYEDKALSKKVDFEGYAGKKDGVKEKYIKVPKAGTYYLGLWSTYGKSSYATPFENAMAVGAAFINGGDRTITSGKTIAVGAKEKQTNYFKFKATKTGYLKVQTSKGSNGSVALYTSKKKALSKDTRFAYVPTYGVKKGTTYYIKSMFTFSYPAVTYSLRATNTAISESSGSTKAKARSISAKKTRKGTITAGSATADWYKLSLSSPKNFTITMKGATNDQLKLSMYDSKGKSIMGGTGTLSAGSASGIGKETTTKFPKGTYYIKIYRGNKYSSGWYSLSWK